jgi:hypothetical protein
MFGSDSRHPGLCQIAYPVGMRFLGRLLRRLKRGPDAGKPRRGFEPPAIEREIVGHLFRPANGLPRLDWGQLDVWREKHPHVAIRAVAGAWLDELRDVLEDKSRETSSDVEYRRWRHERIEGLAPADDGLARRASQGADRAMAIVERSLRPVLGDARVPDVAVVVFRDADPYYSFKADGREEEGVSATSSGYYRNEGGDSFPLIVTHTQTKWHLESTIAHEMAHHAMCDLDLPLWLEEGFAQMMEERVTGYTGFRLDREMVARQRERWSEGLDEFWSYDAFVSPREDDQELAYHLAEWLVRAALADQPERFFAFVRSCAGGRDEAAAVEHFGCELEELGFRLLGWASSDC